MGVLTTVYRFKKLKKRPRSARAVELERERERERRVYYRLQRVGQLCLS
jgi:hypothetical protein